MEDQNKPKLCLTCHIQHVQKTPSMVRGLLSAGLSQLEIDNIFDMIEARTEVPEGRSHFDQIPDMIAQYAGSGVVSPEEVEAFETALRARYVSPTDDPGSAMHVPNAFTRAFEDPAVLQARKDAAERDRKARFAQRHPKKHAEYQRKYREKQQKKQNPE